MSELCLTGVHVHVHAHTITYIQIVSVVERHDMVHVQCSLVNISVKVCRTLIKHCPAVLYDSVKRALVTFASEEEAQTAFDKYLAKPAGKFVLKKYHLNHSSKYKYASVCVCVHVHNFLYRVPLLMCDSADSGSDAVLRLALTRVTCGVATKTASRPSMTWPASRSTRSSTSSIRGVATRRSSPANP